MGRLFPTLQTCLAATVSQPRLVIPLTGNRLDMMRL
jgi:hypothetical protein